jgi:hypothetical protein
MHEAPPKAAPEPSHINAAVEPPSRGGTSNCSGHSTAGVSFHASCNPKHAFSSPQGEQNEQEMLHEHDDMQCQSEILFHSLQHLTGSNQVMNKHPTSCTVISSKVTWNGSKDTCKDFKNMIKGHLNQCSMAYAHNEIFLKEYKS